MILLFATAGVAYLVGLWIGLWVGRRRQVTESDYAYNVGFRAALDEVTNAVLDLAEEETRNGATWPNALPVKWILSEIHAIREKEE